MRERRDSAFLGFQFLDDTENFFGVVGGFHFGVPVDDFSAFIDDKSPAGRRDIAREGYLLIVDDAIDGAARSSGDAKKFREFPLFIRQKREVQIVDFFEDLVISRGIPADSDYLDPGFLEFGLVVAECTSLGGATAGEVGGVEVEDDNVLADMVLGRPFLPSVVDGLERGHLVADV